MKLFVNIVLCICVNFALADTYKAAVGLGGFKELLSQVYEAGKMGVDVMVIPSDAIESENYDDNVRTLSQAAKQTGIYLVSHLLEKTRCQSRLESVRSTLVFDRQGSIVALYKKPLSNLANCTTTPEPVTFHTDFGVTFRVMMEEDLVLKTAGILKNFVMAGDWSSEISYYNAAQFSATWAYTNKVNLVSAVGIFAGRSGAKNGPGNLLIADLAKNCDEKLMVPPVVDAASIPSFPGEDWSQYIIRPLDVITSSRGCKETVCHNSFCCQFDLKTRTKGDENEVSYGLAVFDGVRHYGGTHYIGVQTCAVFACAGLYKRTCSFGSVKNNTNIVFEKLSINANLSTENIHYPVILSNQHLSADQFSYVTKTAGNTQTVKMTVTGGDSLLTFGIMGRIFDRDYESYSTEENGDFYEIFAEDVQEFFDYLWIRVRILLFVVSIYILEML